MRLETSHMRYLSKADFKVLQAMESGSRNHEIVPTSLLLNLSGIRNKSLLQKSISVLSKINLITRDPHQDYDGWRLTYHGFDYLGLKALVTRDSISAVGHQIGIGKESDIYTVANDSAEHLCLKVHRLGRVSFRGAARKSRDYHQGNSSVSWLTLSKLSAQKEFIYMKLLYDAGFSVPRPIDCSRHCIVMDLVEGVLLRKIRDLPDPARLYALLMDFIARLADYGLIHCDFNEFNILVREYDPDSPDSEAIVIDFPQCVSIDHPNGQEYFERDVDSIRHYFATRFGVVGDYPKWKDVQRKARLDYEASASGVDRKAAKELDKYLSVVREEPRGDELEGDFHEQSDSESSNNDIESSKGQSLADSVEVNN